MAIHTDTVLVVALVGSLGYYLFFYQDDPKVQAEKTAKIQTSVANQRLQRVSSRTCAAHFSGTRRKNPPEELSRRITAGLHKVERRSSAASSQGI